MIRIVIENKEKPESIVVEGHAGYGVSGTDIVCASVSSILITTINAMLRVDENSIRYVQKEAYNNSIKVRKVESLEQEVSEPVVKFMVVGEPEELNKAYGYLRNIFDGILNVFFSEPYFLEITPLGIEKASALEKLTSLLHMTKDNLMACGDGLNDIPMLQFAGLSVAMENAYDDTKQYADFISKSNEENGVAFAIKKYIL